MKVIGKHDAPRPLSFREGAVIPTEMGGAPEPVWTIWRQEKSLNPAGIRALARPASSLVTCAFTTLLPFSISASLFLFFSFLFTSMTIVGCFSFPLPPSFLLYFGPLPEIYYQKIMRLPTSIAFKGS